MFSNLVKEHRYEQLKMLSLDMKGLSGTIGAEDMNREIDEIQKLLVYKKYDSLPNYVGIYKREMVKLSESIHMYIQTQ